MDTFTEGQLRAYVEAVDKAFGLGIRISDTPVTLHGGHSIEFRGRRPGQRKERVFAMPLEVRRPGVVVARSVLEGRPGTHMSWLVNGQAASGCREVVHIGASSDRALSLHASLEMLREWAREPLARVPEDRKADAEAYAETAYGEMAGTGLYAEEVSIGAAVDRGGETLVLELRPAVEAPAAEPAPAPAP
jgi:hypothetical protein